MLSHSRPHVVANDDAAVDVERGIARAVGQVVVAQERQLEHDESIHGSTVSSAHNVVLNANSLMPDGKEVEMMNAASNHSRDEFRQGNNPEDVHLGSNIDGNNSFRNVPHQRIDCSAVVVDPALSFDEENPPSIARQGVFIAGEPPETPPVTCKARAWMVWRSTRTFTIEYHMPLLLLLALLIGIAFPLPGKALADVGLKGVCFSSHPAASSNQNNNATSNLHKGPVCVWTSLSALCVSLIFVISGLKLDLNKFRQALTARKEILVSFVLMFGITGAFGFAVAAAPPLEPREFSFGLALFALMPTTMSSCVIIVAYAGGNVALALLLTISSNVLAAALLPVTVSSMTTIFSRGNAASGASVDAVQLCLNLVFQVVVPLVSALVLGKAMFPGTLGAWAERRGDALKVVSATLNAVIPWMRISQNAHQFSRTAAVNYLAVLTASVGLHLLFLLLSLVAAMRIFRMRSLEETKAVAFVGAQKTLPIALSVLELLPVSVTGDQGLVLVPMVFMYLFQAIFDSYLAVKWRKQSL